VKNYVQIEGRSRIRRKSRVFTLRVVRLSGTWTNWS